MLVSGRVLIHIFNLYSYVQHNLAQLWIRLGQTSWTLLTRAEFSTAQIAQAQHELATRMKVMFFRRLGGAQVNDTQVFGVAGLEKKTFGPVVPHEVVYIVVKRNPSRVFCMLLSFSADFGDLSISKRVECCLILRLIMSYMSFSFSIWTAPWTGLLQNATAFCDLSTGWCGKGLWSFQRGGRLSVSKSEDRG